MVNEMVRSRAFPVYLFGYKAGPPPGSPDGPMRSRLRQQCRPPLLAVWGQNDPLFLPPGAEAFKRHIPGAVIRFFDTGHFALETHAGEIAVAIRDFLAP